MGVKIKKIMLFILIFILFLNIVMVFSKNCTIPVDGMLITTDTILCPRTYNFTAGLYVMGDGLLLDCNGALLQGNKTGRGVRTFGNHITIKNCKIGNYEYGVYPYYDYDSYTLVNNTFSNNKEGIRLEQSDNNNISGNIFVNNGRGIVGWHSDYNVFKNNIVVNSSNGFLLHDTSYSKFINNTIKNCFHGFRIWWGSYYNEFENNIVTDNGDGFWFDWYSDYNIFRGNIVNNNNFGFNSPSQWYSIHYNNTFVGNEVKNNNYGFMMGATIGSVITDNTIANNQYGIRLVETGTYKSYGNRVYRNDIINNEQGIRIFNSENNTIYHNNIINNSVQAYDNQNNSWDNGVEGNYWSNYDNESEECYDDNPIDGICDSPYVIDFNSRDNYPFTRENGWLFGTVQLSLTQGWNLISIPLILGNNSVAHVFSSISYSKIFSYDSGWKIPIEINNTLGYWIKADDNYILTVEGLGPDNTLSNLNTGWNLIGYPSLNETNISERFDNVTVYMYNNPNWYSYITGRNLNSLNKFIPGYGYWVRNEE